MTELRWNLPLIAALCLVACEVPVSESTRVSMETPIRVPLRLPDPIDAPVSFDGSQPLLEGTQICPRLRCNLFCAEENGEELLDVSTCFSVRATGPARAEGDCLVTDGDGALELAVEPRPCRPAELGYEAREDRFSWRVAAFSSTSARVHLPFERALARELASGAPRLRAIVDPPGALLPDRVTIVAGERSRAPLVELVDADGATLAFDPGQVFVRYDDGSEIRRVGYHSAQVLPAAEHVELTVETPLGELAAGALSVVDPSEVVALDLFAFELDRARLDPPVRTVTRYDDGSPAYSFDYPMAEEAIVWALGRTADGREVRGLPVEWALLDDAAELSPLSGFTARSELEPLDAAGLDEAAPGTPGELIGIRDLCKRPEDRAGPRRFLVEARFGDLREQIELNLELPEVPLEGEALNAWAPLESCLGPAIGEPRGPIVGCACDSTGDPTSLGLALLLLLLAPTLLSARARRSPRA